MKTVRSLIVLLAFFVAINSSWALQKDENSSSGSSGWLGDYWKHKKEGGSGHGKEPAPYRPNAGRMTCDRYPRVCHVSGSPGPDCCKKKCVNVKSDRLNCGMCGNKCRYPEVCCKGSCVNPMHDRKNCGRCGNKCRRGSFCDYGMCSYA